MAGNVDGYEEVISEVRADTECDIDPEVMLGSNRDSKSGKRTAVGRCQFPAGARCPVESRQTAIECYLCEIRRARCYVIVTINHETELLVPFYKRRN